VPNPDCMPLYIPFRFNVAASATTLTRDEFIARQTTTALAFRAAILADHTANAALINLAADEGTWVDSYLAALEEAGLLRDDDVAPPIRLDPKVISTLAVLASGVLVGPSGREIQSPSSLLAFFQQVHDWYGDTPGKLADIAGYDIRVSDDCPEYDIPIPALPKESDFDLGLRTRLLRNVQRILSMARLYRHGVAGKLCFSCRFGRNFAA